MPWAACCKCFFAFLWVRKMIVPSSGSFDPTVHLSERDVAIDNNRKPSAVRIGLKQLKTDPFRKGINLYVGKTSGLLCPVAALLHYLRICGTEPGPLFRLKDGYPLTRARFATEVRVVLSKVGVEQSKYCTHSFCIGAATTAAAKGIKDSINKTLGRWESLAYLQYV